MCGRAEHRFQPVARAALERLFGRRYGQIDERDEVRPTDPLQVIRRTPDGQHDQMTARWGLVPTGMSAQDIKRYSLFNARIESLAESRVFGLAFQTQRGVVPISAYYEWQGVKGKKQKLRLARPDGLPLLVAALWHRAEHAGELVESCTLVTRPATADIESVHDRMPALLLSRDLDAWLTGTQEAAQRAAQTSWPVGVLKVQAAG